MFEKLLNLTTRTKEPYVSPRVSQSRETLAWLMAYAQRPLYDLTIDIIKLAFAISMALLFLRVLLNIILKLWR